jgi:hypothetical protein
MVELHFAGTGFRVFGVTGPTGGHALVVVAGRPDRTIDFYSPHKRTHVDVCTVRTLFPGQHDAVLVVAPQRDAIARGNYVNIDSVEVIP